MIILIYFLIVFFSVFQSATTKLYNRKLGKSSVFNAIKASSSLALFTVMTVGGFEFHFPTLIIATLYGLSLCISMYSGYRALCLGPMAITSMLVSFSVIIPLLWGLTVGGESISLLQGFALILLFTAVTFANYDKIVAARRKDGHEEKSNYKLWLFFVGITFSVNGAGAILQKQHQTWYPKEFNNEFMLFAMLFCTVVFVSTLISKDCLKVIKETKGKYLGMLSGVSNGLSNFLLLSLAGYENASVLFPIISIGTILGVVMCGRFVFKEKLKINHYMALVVGTASVVLLKL